MEFGVFAVQTRAQLIMKNAVPAKKKIAVVKEALELQENGLSLRVMAKQLNVRKSTLAHWLKVTREAGGDPEAAFAPGARKPGPRVAVEFNEAEKNLAKWYRLSKESIPVAAWFFVRSDKTYEGTDELIVRDETAEALRKYEEAAMSNRSRIMFPKSVMRAFHVTKEEVDQFRGKKAWQQSEMITRRGMFETLEDGTSREILPGDTWELDDYSTNQPYYYHQPETGKITTCRQVLAAKDLASASWLGFDHIGRERDAYRGEDILRYIERLVRSHGLPRKLRLERGSWDSSYIHGIEVEGMEKPWGGLDDLMEIKHVFKSKGKAIIEGGFNGLQRWLGHTGIDIGRKRGEFEKAAKRLRQSRNVKTDAKALGFLSQEKSSMLHAEAAKVLNSRQMKRAHLNERVAPEDLIARHGWNTRELHEDDAWYFMPCKKLRIVSGGHVEVKPDGGWAPLAFTVNGIIDGLHLENGHKVLIACDPLRPELGARICNADQSSKNREHFGMGEVLFEAAPCHGLAPQFNAAKTLSPHLIARKKASAAARTTYRAIISTAQGKASKAESTAMNGKGQAITSGDIERGEPAADSPTIPPQGPKVEMVPAKSSRFGRFQSTEDRKAEIARLTDELSETQV